MDKFIKFLTMGMPGNRTKKKIKRNDAKRRHSGKSAHDENADLSKIKACAEEALAKKKAEAIEKERREAAEAECKKIEEEAARLKKEKEDAEAMELKKAEEKKQAELRAIKQGIGENPLFLIDLENTGRAAFDLLKEIAPENSRAICFYTGATMLPSKMKAILPENVAMQFSWCGYQTPNALDFQLVARLGRLSVTNPANTLVVISSDHGFDSAIAALAETDCRACRIDMKLQKVINPPYGVPGVRIRDMFPDPLFEAVRKTVDGVSNHNIEAFLLEARSYVKGKKMEGSTLTHINCIAGHYASGQMQGALYKAFRAFYNEDEAV